MEVVASDERGRKFLLYVLGIAVFLLLLPMIVVVGIFGFLGEDGEVVLDQDVILSHLSDEQQEELSQINAVCEIISDTFRVYDLPANDQRKAQVLYVAHMIGMDEETDFYIRLAGCFTGVVDSASVYDLLEDEFGIFITDEERTKLDERYGVTGAP